MIDEERDESGKSYAMIGVRGREKGGVIPKRMKRKRSNVDNTQNIISFCTGYGGIELGLRRAGVDVRVVCNVEIEAFVQANLVAKIEEGLMDDAPIFSDLKAFPAREFRGKVHGLIGGYPCQPFSSAGKRQGEKDPRHLWPYILKHVRAIRPVWCFWENVQGHATMGLWRVLSDLEEEGYRCAWGIFSAEEVGAPHQRKRVFILACLPNDLSKQELGNPASEGLEGCARESVQGRSEGLTRTDGAELGDTKHDGSSTTQDGRSTCEEQEEGRMQELEGGCKQSQDELVTPRAGNPGSRKLRNGGQDTSGGSEDTQWYSQDQEKSNTSGKNHGSPKLNPNWVEQLMGLPIGWTDLGSWGMELSHKQQN